MAEKKSRRGPAWGKIAAAAIVIAALAAGWRFTPLSEYITAERIAAWARSVRETPWAPAVVIFIYTPAAFVMFPRPLLTLLTVVAFGPWLGFTYGMAGIMLSALATYYAGRALQEKTVKALAGDKLTHMTHRLRRHGFLAVFAVRMVPAAPFAVEGIVAGAAKIRVWDFSLGTFLGMAPGVLATSVFGAQITRALEDPSQINYWIVALVVLVFAAFTYAVTRWVAKQAK